MNFGANTEEKEAFRIMDQAIDAGINFFDTANMYGFRPGYGGRCGATEEIVGRWFSQGGGRREKVVLATKVFGDMHDESDGPNGEPGISAYKIRRHLEGSLKRLHTDSVDLYYIHDYDPHTGWAEIWDAFQSHYAQGKILYVGACNFPARHLVSAQLEADRRHFFGLACSQHKYNLQFRIPELEMDAAARELGLGVVTWSPLNMGMLSGNALKPAAKEQRSAKFAGKLSDAQIVQLTKYAKLCEDFGESESTVALAWILANPDITAPIIGPRTAGHFNDILRALEVGLPQDLMDELDLIFPGASDLYNPFK
jgi:aryl-alcohol dehydrogenase-like predicted oxidoreductase